MQHRIVLINRQHFADLMLKHCVDVRASAAMTWFPFMSMQIWGVCAGLDCDRGVRPSSCGEMTPRRLRSSLPSVVSPVYRAATSPEARQRRIPANVAKAVSSSRKPAGKGTTATSYRTVNPAMRT